MTEQFKQWLSQLTEDELEAFMESPHAAQAERLVKSIRRAEQLLKAKPLPESGAWARSVADAYAAGKGIKLQHGVSPELNPEFGAKVAQAFHGMKHNPSHPDVQRAYGALIDETTQQLNHIMAHGLKVSPIQPGQENPYKNGSKDLFHDIHNNKHMWYFPTEQGFGSSGQDFSDHPLMTKIKTAAGHEMPANDAFRIVHDFFGHAKESNGFGPKGEESAFHQHKQMYSPEAQKALATETRGQNSWVNFGPHGENNRKNPAQTVYADQKAGLLPDWAWGDSKK